MANKRIVFDLKPGQSLTPTQDFELDGFYLNMASLTANAKAGRTMLTVSIRDQVFTLCTLTQDKCEQQAFNLYFDESDEATFKLEGKNSITLTGVTQDIDQEFIPEDDDEFMLDDNDDGRFRFCDTSDKRFMGGMELRHFGLVPHSGFEQDQIDLRADEDTNEEKMLNDNICEGLINAMINSGDDEQIRIAKTLQKKLDAVKSKLKRVNENGGKVSKQNGKVTKSRSKRKTRQ
ncbi:hypothetical protein LRAMOSA00941 [Lichtheimia ramosa]|uniref:Nucleoplasmin-like domain-containing protein n=1 Tax=Lichtheimia ramosa TaxID=688394 RepID=A0A077WAB3_9FUNG|nr:hypothetical protein LRAMOSA00941 [Lichtheimia ramosa]